ASAFEQHFATSGFEQSGNDVDCSALAGAIRAEIAEDFIRLHRKADIADRGGSRIALGERPHLEHAGLDADFDRFVPQRFHRESALAPGVVAAFERTDSGDPNLT